MPCGIIRPDLYVVWGWMERLKRMTLLAGRALQEINRLSHSSAEVVNENVAVSRLRCLLRRKEIDSQTALAATARFQIARSEFGKHRPLVSVLVPMIGEPQFELG